MQIPSVTSLTPDDLWQLTEHGVFPPAKCHPLFGPSYNRKKIDAWVWGLAHSPKVADAVALILARRDPDWANSSDGGPT